MSIRIYKGINNSTLIINTKGHSIEAITQSFDILSIQNQHNKRTLIVNSDAQIPTEIFYLIKQTGIQRVFFIGKQISTMPVSESVSTKTYTTINNFRQELRSGIISDETVLVTSDKEDFLTEIRNLIEQKSYKTVLEVSLDALKYNLNYFKSKLAPNVKTLAIVKAYSYGSGSYEVANYMQALGVDYLGVTILDEGIVLRRAGIKIPILVLSLSLDNLYQLLEYKLEPVIYSFKILDEYIKYVKMAEFPPMPIHIKLETGMNRLGFQENQLPELIERLKEIPELRIRGIMSHLPSSDVPADENFTRAQIAKFDKLSKQLIAATNSIDVIRHICNTAGIERFPEGHFEMVRLGIGLYGMSAQSNQNLQLSSRLKARILQIKNVAHNESVGYSRKGILTRDSRIGVISIGYGDGLNRGLSNCGHVWAHGQLAPIVGNICMDMSMIDLTDIPSAQEGDEVIVFGPENPVVGISELQKTIPYEILTSTAQRVNYIYVKE